MGERACMSGKAEFQRVLLIYNRVAGRGQHHRRLVRALEYYSAAGIQVTIRKTKGPGHAELIANAASAEFDLIVAVGGDGTVNEVINGLGAKTIPLAVLPTGTVNLLAAELGASYGAILPGAETETGWAGELNQRRFALMASVGFDARVVARVGGWTKMLLGRSAYIVGACCELLAMHRMRLNVVADGQSYTAAAAIISKGRFYAGPYEVCPHSRVTARSFQLCLMDGDKRKDVLRYARSLYRGKLHLEPDVRIIEAREIAIEGPAGAPIQMDGDIRGCLPAVAKISPVPLTLVKRAFGRIA
jgi:YegS/Rv2252/BmrU family lipid kinase